MKNGDAITIRRAYNGWIVELAAERPSLPAPGSLVFNEMGYAMSAGDSVALPCLLTFIEKHFAEPAP